MKALIFILLIVSLILETTIITIPLVFLVLLNITVWKKEPWIFPIAFVIGVILDMLLSKTIGISSFYFTLFMFLVLSYQRKFEINTVYFIIASSFLGSLGFLLILGYNNSIILNAILSSIIGTLLFITYSWNLKIKTS